MNYKSWFWAFFNFVFGIGLILLIFLAVPDPELWLKLFGIGFGIGFIGVALGYIFPNRILYYWIIGLNSLLLITGITIIVGIINSALYLKGIYGPMGRGASAVMWAIVALFIPYLIIIPLIQLYQILTRR